MKDKNGIGVLEAMVASSLLGVVILGYLKLSANIANSRKKINVTHNMKDFSLEVARALSNPENCASTFRASNMSSINLASNPTLTSVLRPNNIPMYQVGSTYRGGSLRLSGLSVISYVAPVLAAPDTAGFAVAIEVQHVGATPDGPDRITFLAQTTMRVNGASEPQMPITCFPAIHLEYVFRSGGTMRGPLVINLPLTNPVTRGVRVSNAYIQTRATYLASDRRLKSHISSIRDPLAHLLKLNGYHFVWKNSLAKDLGFIAQEVAEKWPNLVSQPKSARDPSHAAAVKYLSLLAMQVEAIKDLHQEQIAMGSTLDAMEYRVKTLMTNAKNRN